MRKLLIVVDYQNDFVSGSLGFEKAKELEGAICKKIEQFLFDGQDILFTFDTHGQDYLSTQEGRNLPIAHCIQGSAGWELYGKVAEYREKAVTCLDKRTFGSVELADYLREHPYDEVELVGVVSNICVLSNAVISKAALPEAEILIDAACTASNDDAMNEKALDIMQGLQMKIINR